MDLTIVKTVQPDPPRVMYLKRSRRLSKIREIVSNVAGQYVEKSKLYSALLKSRSTERQVMKGLPGEDVPIGYDIEQTYEQSAQDQLVAKALWKKLAHQYHPDKGGDQETFMEAKAAYLKGDLLLLKSLDRKDNNGDDYWLSQLRSLDVLEERLKTTTSWKIYRFHIIRNYIKAQELANQMVEILYLESSRSVNSIIQRNTNGSRYQKESEENYCHGPSQESSEESSSFNSTGKESSSRTESSSETRTDETSGMESKSRSEDSQSGSNAQDG